MPAFSNITQIAHNSTPLQVQFQFSHQTEVENRCKKKKTIRARQWQVKCNKTMEKERIIYNEPNNILL